MANTLRFKRGLASGIPTALAGEPLFTTDTFDLYIGNGTTNTRFQKYIASGATTQILRGDGSLYTFPLAISSPSNGQVLKYNGTSWVNDSDSGITGSLTTNYLPKATGATTLGNSNLINDASGNLGFGVTLSTWSGYGLPIVEIPSGGTIVGAGSSTTIGTNWYYNGAFIYKASSGASYYIQNAGRHIWYYAPSGTAGNTITFTEAGRFHGTGNFGIGTGATDSGQKLQVVGTGYFSSNVGIGTTSPSQKLHIGAGNIQLDDDYAIQWGGATNFIIGSNASNYLRFYTNNAERIRITSAGNIGIGTSVPSTTLDVRGNTSIQSDTAYYRVRRAAGTDVGYITDSSTWGSSGTDFSIGASSANLRFFTNNSVTERMRLDASGNLGLGVTPNAWGSSWKALELSNGVYLTGFSASAVPIMILGTNAHFDNTNFIYKTTGNAATRYQQDSGVHYWYNAPSGTAGNAITFTQAMTLTANSRLILNSTTDTGEQLQVTGTMKVTGASYLATSSGNVGIGTTSPNYKLDLVSSTDASLFQITSTASANNTALRMGIDGNNAFINATGGSSGTLQLRTYGSTRATLDTNGNLGLAVTPSAWFSNSKAFQTISGSLYTFSTDRIFLGQNAIINSVGVDSYYANGFASRYGQYQGTHFWQTAPSGTAGNAITFTQAMTLDASGRLLVGGTSTYDFNDAARLVVANTSANSTISIVSSPTSSGYLAFADGTSGTDKYSGMIEYNHNTNYMEFRTNGVGAMHITSGSNVLIGSTTSSGEKLQVTGTAKVTGATTTNTHFQAITGGRDMYFNPSADFGNGQKPTIQVASNHDLQFATNNTLRLTIASTGAATFSSSVTAGGQLTASTTTGGTSAIFQNTGAQNSNGIELRGGTAGTAVNWKIEKDNTASSAFQITPSTTNGGTTYTTPVFTLASSGAATFTGNLTVDTNTLFVDATNNRVGIGTTSPSQALQVNGDVLLTSKLYIGTTSVFLDYSGGDLDFATSGAPKMRITSGGNVLVGTTTDSGYKFRVNGTSYYDDNARFPNNKGVIFVQTGGTLLGSISMDTGNRVTIDNNGFSGLSVATDHTFLGGNFSVGHSGAVFGGGTRAMSMLNGTAPSSSFADAFLMYSNDVTAGNAAPHFRTENGAVIKLYQETTSVGNSIFSQGGGNSVLDDSTFDGYTLRQIVKALRNQGILA